MIAQFALADEKITLQKAVGVLIGFVGIALTFWPSIDFEGLADGSGGLALLGLGAFLIAGACYGFSTVYARKHLMGHASLGRADHAAHHRIGGDARGQYWA